MNSRDTHARSRPSGLNPRIRRPDGVAQRIDALVSRPHRRIVGCPLLAQSGHSSLNAGYSQIDTWFRARGGAFPFSLPKVQIDGTTGETWIYVSCGSRANEVGVCSVSYQSCDLALAGLLFSQHVAPKC
jgi:hypothetical protein